MLVCEAGRGLDVLGLALFSNSVLRSLQRMKQNDGLRCGQLLGLKKRGGNLAFKAWSCLSDRIDGRRTFSEMDLPPCLISRKIQAMNNIRTNDEEEGTKN